MLPVAARWIIVAGLLAFGPRIPVARADPSPYTVSLTPSLPSGQPVGTTVTWAASVTGMTAPEYRFGVGPAEGPVSVVRDFSPANTFAWTPLQEGSYEIEVTVEDGFTATTTISATAPFTVVSRVTGSTAVISATANPDVALYSALPCSEGQMAVMFQAVSATSWTYTPAQPCQPGISLNFLVAGMRAGTTYLMQSVISATDGTTTSAPQSFTPAGPPAGLQFPQFAVIQPPAPQADLQAPIVFHMLTALPYAASAADPVATDLSGNVVWYYNMLQAGLADVLPVRIEPGGDVLLLGQDASHPSYNVLREIDLAGDTVRETNVDVINAQLAAQGQAPITYFSHEVLNLPNGDLAALASTEEMTGDQDILGDMVIVLDPNLQVVWTWNPFDHLPYTPPILGEMCYYPCPLTASGQTAVDWLHTNAISWSPTDQNLTLSLRHQDQVIKIDYANGTGDGHVIWRLGSGGNFSLTSTDPYPWFSHQHDAHYVDPTTMVVFDNGNTRCLGATAPCDSRGQVYSLDEQSLTATLLLNADLGNYSQALGSAQRLANGNYVFTSGFQLPGPLGQSIEVGPDGTKLYVQQVNSFDYRSYRISDLYSGINPDLEPCADLVACATATPTNTPPVPTNTPVPATSTPTPLLFASPPLPSGGTSEAPATNPSAPSSTPVPPTATPIPPSATALPRNPAGTGMTARLPLAVDLSTRTIVDGQTLTVRVQTAPHTPVQVVLHAAGDAAAPGDIGSNRTRAHQSVAPYQVTTAGASDIRGQFIGRIRVTDKIRVPEAGTLTVRAGTGEMARADTISVIIQPVPLLVRIATAQIRSGRRLTLTVRTAAHATINVLLQVLTSRLVPAGTGGARHTVRRVVVLYQQTLHGRADAKGRFTGHIPIRYRSSRSAGAGLAITARSPAGASVSRARVTIQPPGHG